MEILTDHLDIIEYCRGRKKVDDEKDQKRLEKILPSSAPDLDADRQHINRMGFDEWEDSDVGYEDDGMWDDLTVIQEVK
jgi:hypothetical protein